MLTLGCSHHTQGGKWHQAWKLLWTDQDRPDKQAEGSHWHLNPLQGCGHAAAAGGQIRGKMSVHIMMLELKQPPGVYCLGLHSPSSLRQTQSTFHTVCART